MAHLAVSLRSLDDKVKFAASARDNPEIMIDYFPPVGTGEGYTSLELLMAAFGSCLATTALTILRHRMRKAVDGVSVRVEGAQREEHPKSLETMRVTLTLQGKDLSEAEVRQAVQAAEDSVCPVWAMLKGNVEVKVDIEIV